MLILAPGKGSAVGFLVLDFNVDTKNATSIHVWLKILRPFCSTRLSQSLSMNRIDFSMDSVVKVCQSGRMWGERQQSVGVSLQVLSGSYQHKAMPGLLTICFPAICFLSSWAITLRSEAKRNESCSA